jgi:serine/threonine protein kinase
METQIITGSSDENIHLDAEKDKAAAVAGGMLRPGENIAGYAVERLISTAGGEAEIYLCAKGGDNFALKYYYTKKPNTEVIEKIKAFSHPDIISILEYGEYKDRFFTVLEYAAGFSLDDGLPDGAYRYLPVSEEEARQIVSETINAFDSCHKAGVIQRDIKPGNLFYKNVTPLPDGTFKGENILVRDFGIASIFEGHKTAQRKKLSV